MALIKCSDCGHDISDLAVICPNCGALLKSIDLSPKKVVKRKPRMTAPKPASSNKGLDWKSITGATATLCILGAAALFVRNSNDPSEDKPVNPEVIKQYSDNSRSGMLDARTTVFALIQNKGGAGKVRATFALVQGKHEYKRDTIFLLRECEKTTMSSTFSEVRIIDGKQSFNVEVKPF